MGLLPPPYLVASEPSKPHFCHLEFSKMNYDNAHMAFCEVWVQEYAEYNTSSSIKYIMYVCTHTAVCQHNFSASYYAYGIRSWYGYRKSTSLPAGFVSCCPKDVMSSSTFFLVPTSLYTGRALRTVVVILNQAISCLRQYFFLLRNCCLSVTNCNVVVIRRYYPRWSYNVSYGYRVCCFAIMHTTSS